MPSPARARVHDQLLQVGAVAAVRPLHEPEVHHPDHARRRRARARTIRDPSSTSAATCSAYAASTSSPSGRTKPIDAPLSTASRTRRRHAGRVPAKRPAVRLFDPNVHGLQPPFCFRARQAFRVGSGDGRAGELRGRRDDREGRVARAGGAASSIPSSDIYGGLGSSYDYGHYGVLLKQNVKAEWQRAMVQEREDIVLLDSAIILHPQVWVASGHVGGFSDPLVDCRTCKLRFRADHLETRACGRRPSKHPGETPDCDLTEARAFNLMFETLDRRRCATTARSPTCGRRPRRASSSTSRTSPRRCA